MSARIRRVLMTAMFALVVGGSYGCTVCCSTVTPVPVGSPANEVVQEFPASGPVQTAWRVRWATADHRGLYITGAWFKRAPGEAWLQVLYDARLADIFVPYHSGSPRYFDLSSFNFQLVTATAADAGCCGSLLGQPPKVVKEVRDRGVLWKDDTTVRRGQELVLWATLDAANYNYIMEYGFRDDGTITFRIGATARNLPGIELEAHMHAGLWRIDVDLGGAARNSVLITSHQEPAGSPDAAADNTGAFNGGVEGFADWQAEAFTEIRVVNEQRTNAHGRNIGYDLMLVRRGTARHTEAFSHHDFWATRYHFAETVYTQLPTYIGNGESVTDTDIVLWHISPVHHLPRDEDGEYQGALWKGVALVMWGGFDLRPRNLFDRTPLHP